MAHYFFNIRDAEKIDIDDEGIDLPDDKSAINAAKDLLSALAAKKLPNGDHMAISVTVRTAEGLEIYVARLILDGLRPTPPERDR